MSAPIILTIATFAVSLAVLWGGRKIALAYGFADKPGGRKKHDNPVPPIGGLIIVPAFGIFTWAAGLQEIVPLPLLAGLFILLLMGAIDDAFSIKALVKFFIMVWTCCFVVVFGQARIVEVGNLFGFGIVELGIMTEAFSVMSIVLLMNAINMIDGADGLAGGFCALVVTAMLIVCAMAGQMVPFWALAILLAALLAFLAFNMRYPGHKRASVFLGDSGSLCMGLLLGWFCIKLTQGASAPLEPATVIWIIALPVMDAFALFLARSLRGLHPFNADRRHLHHRFLDAGISPGRTTFIMLILISLFAFVGFAAQAMDVPPVVLFWLWMAVFTLHTIGIMHPRGYTLFSRFLRVRSRESRG